MEHKKYEASDREINAERVEEAFGKGFLEQSREWIRRYNKLMAYYRCAIMEVETKLNVLNEEFSLQFDRNPINGIKSRLKHPMSIKEKLDRRGLPLTHESIEENLGDVAGVRVICSFPEDVYTIARALLSQDDITLVEKKDYIQNPKENGYRSLHLIITVPIFLASEKRIMKVEVQLRTIAMDVWASLEHQLRYKKDITFTEDMANELLHCAGLSAELDARMNALYQHIDGGKNSGGYEESADTGNI